MPEQMYDKYRKIQVETANPAQLIVLMYEGITRFLTRAAVSLEQNNPEDADHWMDRASAVVQELLGNLDFDAGGDIARNLGSIYTMTLRETLVAKLRKDPEKLKKLAFLYSDLKLGWATIAAAKAV